MTERDALLHAICANPDDDTARLVFADWLQDNGDASDQARAEFIRAQIELACGVSNPEREAGLRERERQLHEGYADKWIERMCRWDRFEDYDTFATYLRNHFVRGFLHHVEVPLAKFAQYSRRLYAAEPIAEVTASLGGIGNGPELYAFVNSPDAARVTGIWDSRPSSYLGPSGFCRLVGSSYLTRLRHLGVFEDRIGVTGVRALVASSILSSLRELELYGALATEVVYRPISGGILRETRCDPDEAVEILVNTPKVRGLQKLNLMFNCLSERAAVAILDSPHLTSLRAIAFEQFDPIDEELERRLAERFPEDYWTYRV